MNWIAIISLTILVLASINLLIVGLNQSCFFLQVLYVFIFDREIWKKYKRLKKYLKTNTIPFIHMIYYTGINIKFAFVWYDDTIFIAQGSSIYLSSYYNKLIENLLKHNNHDS